MAAQGPKRTITISLTSKKCGPGDPCHILIDIFQYVHSTGSRDIILARKWPKMRKIAIKGGPRSIESNSSHPKWLRL